MTSAERADASRRTRSDDPDVDLMNMTPADRVAEAAAAKDRATMYDPDVDISRATTSTYMTLAERVAYDEFLALFLD